MRYLPVVDRIVSPHGFFEPLRNALQAAGHGVADTVLRVPIAVCVSLLQRWRRQDCSRSSSGEGTTIGPSGGCVKRIGFPKGSRRAQSIP